MSRRKAISVLFFVLVVAGLSSCRVARKPTYSIRVDFPSAPGLFVGNAVDLLGVPIGSVARVSVSKSGVVSELDIDKNIVLPREVKASLVSPQLLGEPSIELFPGYTGGARMTPGGVVPETRTSVPVSTNELLKALSSYLTGINPKNIGDLVNNLSQDLSGQSQQLNSLIHNAAGTIQVLANKGDSLGQLVTSLSKLSEVLRSHDTQTAQLITDYNSVSNVIAQSQLQLGQAVSALDYMSKQLAGILNPNLYPLQGDINTLTTAGRTLYRNLSSIDQTLSSTVALFQGAGSAYDPKHQWLSVDLTLSPSTTSAVIGAMVRDQLAGICRRILANHSNGLSASDITTLKACGNPASGFFNSIVDTIPTALSALPGGGSANLSSSANADQVLQSAFSNGLSQIPGITQSQAQSITSPNLLSSAGGGTSSDKGSGATPDTSLDPSINLGPLPKLLGPSNSGGGPSLGSLLAPIGMFIHVLGGMF